jgi:hypothetical protein
MQSQRCACCSKSFTPRPQRPCQSFCSAEACQREKPRRWQQAKRRGDADYRENQLRTESFDLNFDDLTADERCSEFHSAGWKVNRCEDYRSGTNNNLRTQVRHFGDVSR